MRTRHLYWILTGPSFAVHCSGFTSRSKWPESRESARWGGGGGGGINMVSGASGASDQGVCCVYGCVYSRQFQWNHRRPCPTSAAGSIADLVKSCFGGLRALWSGCVGCLWMHLFIAVPMTPLAAMSDVGGRRNRRFLTAAALSACTYVITWDCTVYTLTSIWGEGGW